MPDYQKKKTKERLLVEVHHFIREVIILCMQASEVRKSDPLVCIVNRIFEGCKRYGWTRGSTAVVGMPATSYARSSADCRGAKADITRAIGTCQAIPMRLRVCKALAGGGTCLVLVKLIGLGNRRHSKGDTQRVGQIGMGRRAGRYGRGGRGSRSRVPSCGVRLTRHRGRSSRGGPYATRATRVQGRRRA